MILSIKDFGPSPPLGQELLVRAWESLGKAFWLRDGEMVPMTLHEIAKQIQEFERPRYDEVKL